MKRLVISMVLLGLGSIFAEDVDKELNQDMAKNRAIEATGDYSKKKIKSGKFLGVESEFGSKYDSGHGRIKTDFKGGLLFGAQEYFGTKARHGIKISTHLYGGLGVESINTIRFVYSFGADLKYIYDFLDRDNHSLGLSVGAGYRLEYYTKTFLIDTAVFGLYDRETFMHGVYSTVGMHYLLKKHHLFEVNYRFGGASSLASNYWMQRSFIQSHFAISYAYKF